MKAKADVGMLGREVSVDDDGAELDLQPPTIRHAFACRRSQVHEEPLHAFGSSVNVQRSGSRRKLHFYPISGDTFQHRRNVADDCSELNDSRAATLLVAVLRELSEERRGTRKFLEQHFAVVWRNWATAGRQPLLRGLVNTAEHTAACDGHFSGKPANG